MRPASRSPLVLAYHCVDDVAREHDPRNLVVSPRRFCRQVGRLQRAGYDFVTVTDFAMRLRASGPPRGWCALTFDDGSRDNAEILPPLLEALGVPATLFICPDLLGVPHPWMAPEAGVRLMTASELATVAKHPLIEIGSHTSGHADLSAAGAEDAYREMEESKRRLEELTGRTITSFAYPSCGYSDACPGAAERAGYACAVTCEGRGGWLPYELRREGVAAWDRWLTFDLKTRGIYHAFLGSQLGRRVLEHRQRHDRASRRPTADANDGRGAGEG